MILGGDKLRYSVEECLELLGVSKKHFYNQVRDGNYQVIKDGRRTFMTRRQLINASKGTGGEDV